MKELPTIDTSLPCGNTMISKEDRWQQWLHLNCGNTYHWVKLPPHLAYNQASDQAVDTFGLITLLCLVNVRSVFQSSFPQENLRPGSVSQGPILLLGSWRLNAVLYDTWRTTTSAHNEPLIPLEAEQLSRLRVSLGRFNCYIVKNPGVCKLCAYTLIMALKQATWPFDLLSPRKAVRTDPDYVNILN